MLLNETEIGIAANAQQAGMRNPKIDRSPFESIIKDFLSPEFFQGKCIIDLGPGQYDFSELGRSLGATMEHLENDPAIIALGEYKGFKVWDCNMTEFDMPMLRQKYDGMFCKLSISAFWNRTKSENQWSYFKNLLNLIKDDGWGFIAPWNGLSQSHNLSAAEIESTLNRQRSIALSAGFSIYLLPERINNNYGLGGITEDKPLFIKNTKIPNCLSPYLYAKP